MDERPNLMSVLGLSSVAHVALVGAWAAMYAAPPADGSVRSRTVSSVRMIRKGQPPPAQPKPKPRPDPEPEAAEPEPPPPDKIKKPRRRGPPPPPPPECQGCALFPATAKLSHRTSGGTAIPVGTPGGVPGGVVGGVAGGVVGGTLGGVVGGTLGAPLGVAQKQVPPEPLDAAMARAIFSPDPDPKLLARTPTGLMSRGSGVTKTWFCIDERGRTTDIKTTRRFPNDPKIDAICRDTVKKWRFRPLIVGGKKVKTCTVARFEIHFD